MDDYLEFSKRMAIVINLKTIKLLLLIINNKRSLLFITTVITYSASSVMGEKHRSLSAVISNFSMIGLDMEI
jgi:hypothetical protein